MINPLIATNFSDFIIQFHELGKYLLNCSVLLYQKSIKKSLNFGDWDNFVIDYNYVPPNLQFNFYFLQSQMNTVIEFYVLQSNKLLDALAQSDYNNIAGNYVNLINQGISNINWLATSLWNEVNNAIINYTIPYNMSIRTALFLNNMTTDNLNLIAILNSNNIGTLNFIRAGTTIQLI